MKSNFFVLPKKQDVKQKDLICLIIDIHFQKELFVQRQLKLDLGNRIILTLKSRGRSYSLQGYLEEDAEIPLILFKHEEINIHL